MAPQPMSFAAFKSHCVLKCGERDPPDEANCSICMEEYDRAEHQAMRIHVALPMPCYHDFCRKCLNIIFARRKSQDGANICPLCRAPWFKAEYENAQAQVRRAAEARPTAQSATGTVFPMGSTHPTFTFGSQATTGTPGTIASDTPQHPSRRIPRPYARTGGTAARTAQPSAPPSTLQPPQDWRILPVFLAREIRDAINRQEAEATTASAPPPPTQRPTTGPTASSSFSFGPQPAPAAPPPPSQRPAVATPAFSFGQPPTSATAGSVLDPILGPDFFSNASNEGFFQGVNNAAQQASRKRPAPASFTSQDTQNRMAQSAEYIRQAQLQVRQAELDVRAAELNARELLQNQREEQLNMERREFEQQQQQQQGTNTASAQARGPGRQTRAQRAREQREAAARRGQ